MKNNLLTVLGSSGSLAMFLMAGTAAQANTESAVQEYVFTAADYPSVETAVDAEVGDCGCSNPSENILFNDEVGDRAIELMGCDCAGCRFMVRSASEMSPM
jgi:hypothetical protein